MNKSRCSDVKISVVSGFWGTNIGNAFFNLGGRYFLSRVFENSTINFISDQPGYYTFHNQMIGNPKNSFDLIGHLNSDYIVLQGPVFTETLDKIWGESLERLMRKGVKLIMLGVAFFKFTQKELDVAINFINKYQPAIISTRDEASYQGLRKHFKNVYNGIDSGFFVNDVYKPFNIDCNPLLINNFDRFPEPNIYIGSDPGRYDHRIVVDNSEWFLEFPKIHYSLSKLGKWQSYIGSLLDRRELSSSINGMNVIRPEHRYNPHVGWKIYKNPNSIASDEPYTYLSIYGNSNLTLSDRVHACVATLAYGNKAMLFSPTPRAKIFDRLNLGNIRNEPVSLEKMYLDEEKNNQLNYFKKVLLG